MGNVVENACAKMCAEWLIECGSCRTWTWGWAGKSINSGRASLWQIAYSNGHILTDLIDL